MENIISNITEVVGEYVPHLIGALSILILGWLVALIVSAVTRTLLNKTTLDNKIAQLIAGEEGKPLETEKWISKGVFYVIMIFVLIAFFESLELKIITDPLNRLLSNVFGFLPRIMGAGVLLLVAWIVASMLRMLLKKGLEAARLDEKLGEKVQVEGKKSIPVTSSLAHAVYWIVFLLFLPAILSALALEGLLSPVQGMIDSMLAMLPNIFAAGIILFIGWFIARIIRGITANLLSASGIDRLGEKIGITKVMGSQTLSGVLGMLLYVLILIPVAIAALDTLKIEAISTPAKNMLQTALDAVPSIFAAAFIIVIAYVVGRLVCELVTNLLAGVGFNAVLAKLGIGKEAAEGKKTPSEIVGYIALIAIMLLAAIEASQVLDLTAMTDLISRFMVFSGHILMGLVIFGIGLFIANLASSLITGTNSQQSSVMALAARLAIIVLASAMALKQMGLADEIVTLAFGILFGAIAFAIALAVALAVGIGSKETAAREVEKLLAKIKGTKEG